jgi:hypothetical protein
LQGFFDTVEDTMLCPVTKAAVDRIPVAEFFGQGSPSTTVFVDILQGLKKAEIVNLYITALLRKQMPKTLHVLLCPFHY